MPKLVTTDLLSQALGQLVRQGDEHWVTGEALGERVSELVPDAVDAAVGGLTEEDLGEVMDAMSDEPDNP